MKTPDLEIKKNLLVFLVGYLKDLGGARSEMKLRRVWGHSIAKG